MAPLHETSYYTTTDTLSPGTSAANVAAIGLVGFFSLLFVAIGLMRQAAMRARAAKAAERGAEDRTLVPGFAVLHGQVETGDSLPAVRVRIEQTGRQYRVKNGMRHVWTEVTRRVDARPFYLRLASGERVRVLPGDTPFLVDVLAIEPGPFVPPDVPFGGPPRRVRSAELTHPDYAYACGRLVAPLPAVAYRSAEEGYALHPWQGQMHLSTEPLEERYARRARFHVGWLLACVAAFLFTNGLLFGGYWLELVWGRPVVSDSADTRSWTTHGKHGPVQHYGVTAHARVDDRDLVLASETNVAFYATCPSQVPFLVVPFHPSTHDLGTQPTVRVVTVFFAWTLFVGVAVIYFARARKTRPWYERKKVIDTGSGPLGSPDALA